MNAEPGGREPAPEPLVVVQRFVNTNDREGDVDELDTPAALGAWLRDAGLASRLRVTRRELARAHELREALRALLLANNGARLDGAAVRVFAEAAARARLTLRYDAVGHGAWVSQAPGVDGALGRVLGIVHDAVVAGTWPRLKACRRDACRWAFYDHSKNRSGTWCAMSVCGNRVKSSRYWERRRRD